MRLCGSYDHRRVRSIILCLLPIFVATIPNLAFGLGIAGCADDLDRLARKSRDAADAARTAERECKQYENCITFPDTFDLLGDNCSMDRMQCSSRRRQLESSLDDVESGIVRASTSCEYTFTLDPNKRLQRLMEQLKGMEEPPKQ